MTNLSTLDWLLLVVIVCLPLGASLLAAELLRRRDRRRWCDSAPIEDGGLSGRARW